MKRSERHRKLVAAVVVGDVKWRWGQEEKGGKEKESGEYGPKETLNGKEVAKSINDRCYGKFIFDF